ncbi:pilus assembly protein [Microbacterium capsulatum]|uniref:Pilus assembly protein n=1 Tax=Microbacterium capsulatum TaxID=3041921 RepID=A0ABU0XE62_9MICO|nr:pilus assembly protein [Microbacterium sp. ASV81]MDQ4213402.1 pilus assembly protein [Microbacterium sp. ASV81]
MGDGKHSDAHGIGADDMRWLRDLLREQQGATAVFVALLMVPLLGIGAIAVDVGALFAERAQLQDGVDAAAFAVASSCAKNVATCGVNAQALAQQYVTGNASIPRGATANNPVINLNANTVTVTAQTNVNHILAGAIVGGSSEKVTASGSAQWGTPIAGKTLPLAIGLCEFAVHPPTDPSNPNPIKILVQYNTQARAGCDPTYAPGGFGWLNATACVANIDFTAGSIWVKGQRGNSIAQSGCTEAGNIAPLRGTTVLIPIYDSFKQVNQTCTEANVQNGGTICFHLLEFAAFKLTGFKLSGSSAYVDPTAPACNGSCRGLQGYFLKYVAVSDAFTLGNGGPGSDGFQVVQMIITPSEMSSLTGH